MKIKLIHLIFKVIFSFSQRQDKNFMSTPTAIYHPQNPQFSNYYRCVEGYLEIFVGIYEEHFIRQYWFVRPTYESHLPYLNYSDIHNGGSALKVLMVTNGNPHLDFVSKDEDK